MATILQGVEQQRALISENLISPVNKKSTLLFRLAAIFRTWRKRSIERNYLLTSDYRLRLDLLATRQEIESEVSKPFWRS